MYTLYVFFNQQSKHGILQSLAFEVCKCVILGSLTAVSQPAVTALEHFHYCHNISVFRLSYGSFYVNKLYGLHVFP